MFDTSRISAARHETLRNTERAVANSVLRTLMVVLLLSVFAAEASAQYGGPSMLSRGGNRPGRRGRAPVDFTFYAGVRATVENGLLPPRLNAQGTVDPVTAYGGSVEAGLYGGHEWRRSSVGVDYRGDYRHNDKLRQLRGSNHAVSLEFEHAFSKRTSLLLRETGGTSNRAFGGFAAPAFAEVDRLGVPLNEVFDVRTYYSQASATISHRKSARMTLAAEGDGFFVKRKDLSLINGQGYSATGYLDYRLTRRTQVGALYQFIQLDYPRVYSGAETHSVAGRVQHVLSRRWDAQFTGGLYRITSFGTQLVQLSPEVAFILGRSTGLEAFTRVLYRPRIDARANFTQDRGRFTIGYTSGVGTGNGVYTATSNQTVRAGYSYSGLRRTSIGVSAGYTRTSSVTTSLRAFRSYQTGVGYSYRLMEHVNFNAQLDYRSFDAPGLRGREGFAAAIGLSYTPSRFPLSIW